MCEPHHSIVQYPDEDDRGPTGTRIDALVNNTQQETFWDRLKKKIKSWFHLSRMGFGHSEAIGAIFPFARTFVLPQDTKYEVGWWDRTIWRDGGFYGRFPSEAGEALQAAEEYARRVSIGNLTLLRQFLENSMAKTERPIGYVQMFSDKLLIVEGRDAFWKKLKKLLGVTNFRDHYVAKKVEDAREMVTKVMLGLTRVREYLSSAWRDDDTLWVPAGT